MGLLDFWKKRTLYHPDCETENLSKKESENYEEIFRKLGIRYFLIKEKFCCGHFLLKSGRKGLMKKAIKKNFEIMKKNSVKKVIADSPSCYYFLKFIYPKYVRNFDLEIEHASVSILKKLRQKNIMLDSGEGVFYHDPCFLGRWSKIYGEPREVIVRLGGEVIEFKKNKSEAVCCGAGGGLFFNYPEISKKAAELRLREVKNDEKIVTPCRLCNLNFLKTQKNSMEFSEYVLSKLREARL